MQFQFHLSVVVVWSESVQSCEPVYVCYCASSIPIPIYRSINMKFTIINRQSCPALLLCPQVPPGAPRCPQVPLVPSGACGVPKCLWCPQVPLVSPGTSGVPSASGVPRYLWCPQVPLVSPGTSVVPRCLWCHQVPLVSPGTSGVPRCLWCHQVPLLSPVPLVSVVSAMFPW